MKNSTAVDVNGVLKGGDVVKNKSSSLEGFEAVHMPDEQKDAWVVALEGLRTNNFNVAVQSFIYLAGLTPEQFKANETSYNAENFIAPFTYGMAALSATLTVKESKAHTRGYLEGLAARTESKFFPLLECEKDEYMNLLMLATQQLPDVLIVGVESKVKKMAIDQATYQVLALLATVANENSFTAADMLDIAENNLSTQL